ncbi:hypothetical protein DP939_38740 [Spongiactinospora rosea]|uniref:Endonuclease/exonuclease/phosphatase domain-containing protein n=1 Tax=Spongiactinospora rosea TaxID=2248750 RepID=A0A366LN96_9ACTN|nr:hypothetical protein DP939_38740 [Spongiactinospora rosea]
MIAVLTAMLLELLRALGPLADSAAAGAGVVAAVLVAPVLAWPLGRALGDSAVIVSVAGLVAARLGLQAVEAPPYALGLAAVVLGMIALVLTVGGAEGGAAAAGLPTGIALDVAVRSLFFSWDVIWQPGPLPWVVTGALCAAALALAWKVPRGAIPAGPRAWVVGPFLGLATLMLGSPAFAASQAGVPLPVASGVLIMGALFAVVVAGEAGHAAALWRRRVLWAAGPALACALTAALLATGPVVLAALAAAQLCAALLLARALAGDGREGVGLAGLAAGLGFAVVVLPYQAHQETPLGVPGLVWPLAGTAMLALAAHLGRPRAQGAVAHEFHLAGGCAVALLAPVIALVTTPAPAAKTPARAQFKLLSWNVQHGVTGVPAVDPEAIAKLIEERDPDVVMLQGVARGLPAAAGVDLAEWLTRRLRPASRVWAPGAGRQSGNLILTRVPLTGRGTGGGPPYATGTMTLPGDPTRPRRDGRPIHLITTQLRHPTGDAPALRPRIGALLTAWNDMRPAVVAGDLGRALPRRAENAMFDRAGFSPAAEPAGALAAWRGDRGRRDWIWATKDLIFRDFRVLNDVTVLGPPPLEATIALAAP